MAKRGRPAGNYSGETNGVYVTGVGYTLGEARAKRQLTLKQVAGILGVSVQFVSNIEHGRAPLPAKYVPTVANLLGLDVNEVAGLAVMKTRSFQDFKSVTKTA